MPAPEQPAKAPASNHARDMAWAAHEVARFQSEKTFGKLSFEFQEGRLVRVVREESVKMPPLPG